MHDDRGSVGTDAASCYSATLLDIVRGLCAAGTLFDEELQDGGQKVKVFSIADCWVVVDVFC